MAEQRTDKVAPPEEEEEEEEKKKKNADPNLFSCLLQPATADYSDPQYVGLRRLLLHRKAVSGVLRRRVRFPSFTNLLQLRFVLI